MNQKSLSEQLSGISSMLPRARSMHMPNLRDIGTDGTEHVNIWDKGQTNMGKALSTLADLPFVHNVYGKFRSIEGFYHYIRSVDQNDAMRKVAGYWARKAGQRLEVKHVPDFKKIIADANWQKIQQIPVLMEELKNLSTFVALDSYYIQNEEPLVRVRPPTAAWMVPAFHEIRMALQEGREPNFDFLADDTQSFKNSERKKFNEDSLRFIYKTQPPAKPALLKKKPVPESVGQPKQKKAKPAAIEITNIYPSNIVDTGPILKLDELVFITDLSADKLTELNPNSSLSSKADNYVFHADIKTTIVPNPIVSEDGILISSDVNQEDLKKAEQLLDELVK